VEAVMLETVRVSPRMVENEVENEFIEDTEKVEVVSVLTDRVE